MTNNNQNKNLTKSASLLNELVANNGVLYVKLHQYHWHVKGPYFFTLHEKFEELYNETSEYFDEFAERLIALGGRPYSTLRQFLDESSVKEEVYEQNITAEKMVENLVADFETIKQLALKGADLAADENDPVTEDMLVEYVGNLDTTIWMLSAFLND